MNTQLLASLVAAGGAALGATLLPKLIASTPVSAEAAKSDRSYLAIATDSHRRLLSVSLALVFAGSLGWQLGWHPALWLIGPIVPIGIGLATIDWHTKLLPNAWIKPLYLVLPLLILVSTWMSGEWFRLRLAAIGWAVVGGLYLLVWLLSRGRFGYGDVRLAGLLGMWLGYFGFRSAFFGTYAGLVLFVVFVLGIGLLRGNLTATLKQKFPFGPFMIIGAWLGVVIAFFVY